jgi:hypothetical protein
MAHQSEPVRQRLRQKTMAARPAESRPMGDSPGFLPWPRPKRMEKMRAEVQKPRAALWRVLKAHW